VHLHGGVSQAKGNQKRYNQEQILFLLSRTIDGSALLETANSMRILLNLASRFMADLPQRGLYFSITSLLLVAMPSSQARAESDSHPWIASGQFAESSFTKIIDPKIRINVNAPLDNKSKPAPATRLIVYALPNGNTLEQTLGCQMKPNVHWRYDIQHVAAQVRLLRTLEPNERIVVICAEAPGLSWPSFRAAHKDASSIIHAMIEKWRTEFGSDETKIFLTGHSGGGGFIFSEIEASDEIPAYIDRIAFLDANYNFDAKQHAGKFERWLKADNARRLVVIAYDDREITYEGKKVVGPTGGTFRATGRMRDALGKIFPLAETTNPPFQETTGLDGRIHFFVHPNYANKILHTALVGDMNGLVHAATLGTPNEEKWGHFGGPRAYTIWLQPEPTPARKSSAEEAKSPAASPAANPPDGSHLKTKRQSQLPARPEHAIGGSKFMKSLEGIPIDKREAAILGELSSGNFPDFLRDFKEVPIGGSLKTGGKDLTATLEVMPDYIAVGSDRDFVRIPMTPQSAQQIADKFGCTLPTRKMVDAIDRAAEVRLAPHPMTIEREAIATFAEHNTIIEKQRGDEPLGLLVIGTKKDIVLTPRIFEKPKRLAIYGWRQLNGQPIQPLTIAHWSGYVDYSHGVRLVRDKVDLNGKSTKISDLLADSDRCSLVSDEGPMKPPRYPAK
jgi:hypothetical protein